MTAPAPAEMAARMRRHPSVARVADAFAQTPGSWLVGGAVRDLLLGRSPLDVDVVVEDDLEAAAAGAAQRLGSEVRFHGRFGTATLTGGGLRVDVVRARRETYPSPGALPEVEPASLEEDLARRDFTIHALASAMGGGRQGELRHFPGALDDLEQGRLRVMHERSFVDDPTRLLRLVRYGARLSMATDPHTQALARAALDRGAPATVSGARIGSELRLLLAEPHALDGLGRASGLGLDRALHPALRLEPELATAALAAMPPTARRDLVVLAACALDFEPGALRRWMEELEFTAPEREAVISAALGGRRLAGELRGAPASRIAAAARGRPPEQLALAAAFGARDEVQAWERRLRLVRLEIAGEDLLAAGVPEGPQLGRALAAALAAKLDGKAHGREEELRIALRAAGA